MGQSGLDYLGIARSVGGKSWRQRLSEYGENAALHIEQKHNVPAALARVLAARGIEAGNVQAFLNPSLRALMPEPYQLRDMEKAAKRLCQACLKREKIAVFADYDVDGACSAALLLRFLAAIGLDSRLYIPDRLTEGYGPNEKALRLLAAEGASLIITVDCGANSSAVFAAAQLAGVDILVLDHHRPAQPQNGLNKAGGERAGQQIAADFIHVNPNRPDDESGLGYLCAAGVVFMCLTATARLLRARNIQTIPDLLGLLDLVALATICDIVPLYGLNRAFVTKGLLVARQQRNIGLQALEQVARIKAPLNAYHFGYILGPRINAGGRVGDAALGAKLLSCDKADEADHIAAQLDSLNYGRQALEAEQLRQAMEQIEAAASEQNEAAKMVFACGDWHIGIIGLLASRLKERFARPAFIMTRQATGQVTGSARASGVFDIGALIAQALAENVLEKGGGHQQAAGFTLPAAKVEIFHRWLEANLKVANSAQETSAHEEVGILKLDGSLSAGGATVELIEELAKAGPYGAGWPQPLFVFPDHNLAYVQAVGKDGAHLRVILADGHGGRLAAVAFRAGQTELGQFLLSHAGQQAHIAGTLSLNYWNGQTTPQLHITDAAEAE